MFLRSVLSKQKCAPYDVNPTERRLNVAASLAISVQGSTLHLAAELFKSLSGIDALHVPNTGGAPALSDLVGGRLSL